MMVQSFWMRLLSTSLRWLRNIEPTALAEEYGTNYKQSFVKDKDEAIPTKVIMWLQRKGNSCKIENMTEIMCQIFTKLEELPENDSQLLKDVFNRSIKSKNKDAYVAFY